MKMTKFPSKELNLPCKRGFSHLTISWFKENHYIFIYTKKYHILEKAEAAVERTISSN